MITTHVLDLGVGKPASGISVILELRQESEWMPVGRGLTDANGRLATLTDGFTIVPGTYRLTHRDRDVSSQAGGRDAVLP